MKIRIFSISKVRQSFILEGEEEYLQRLKSIAAIERVELSVDAPSSLPEQEIMKREARAAIAKFRKDEYVIVLDETGKELTSRTFAAMLDQRMQRGQQGIAFVIGGAFGTDPELKKRADAVISLSRLTFPYQLTRLILVEQLYRAFSILKGIPYHK